jgi:hypothetical protein
MHPCLVHFPDRESRIVMYDSHATPKPGDVLIAGWAVERQTPAPDAVRPDYDLEIWVKPTAA